MIWAVVAALMTDADGAVTAAWSLIFSYWWLKAALGRKQ